MNKQQKYLQLRFGEEYLAILDLEEITEVFQFSLAEVCPVPQVHESILGIHNWRGEMLWLIDIERMCGYPSLAHKQDLLAKMMIVVIHHQYNHLGLLVREVIDIDSLDFTGIKSPDRSLFSHQIVDVMGGYFIQESGNILIKLDGAAIINSALWKKSQDIPLLSLK
ncbi:chemotaxis protein CheW [Calothrix sp. 336/3]|uniref:chemotaxis protein CheW n=1 Tax=Calothrix sp. 336/3 TaxID=1337936 RepID=UPI0004E418E0|nr:chemotaxis protein CheW [Calothrix sp. 336/3]AKG22652.1 hypothetical protein IJ00_16450 [Calothrix sp. 336/3]